MILLSLLLPFVAPSARPIDLKLDAARTRAPINPFIHESAAAAGSNLPVDPVFNPDKVLGESEHVIAMSDGIVLDRCRQRVNLTRQMIVERIPKTRLVELSPSKD